MNTPEEQRQPTSFFTDGTSKKAQLPTAAPPSQEVEEPKNHGKWEVHPVEIQFECSHGIWAEGNHSSICYCTNAKLAEWIKNQLCLAASQQKEREGRLKSQKELRPGDCEKGTLVLLPEDMVLVGPTETEMEIRNIFTRELERRSPSDPLMMATTAEATASRQAGVIGELRAALQQIEEANLNPHAVKISSETLAKIPK